MQNWGESTIYTKLQESRDLCAAVLSSLVVFVRLKARLSDIIPEDMFGQPERLPGMYCSEYLVVFPNALKGYRSRKRRPGDP